MGPFLGQVKADKGSIEAKKTFANSSSVHFDAVYVPGGAGALAQVQQPDARRFIDEAYKHGKAIAATGEGAQLVSATGTGKLAKGAAAAAQGVLIDADGDAKSVSKAFLAAVARHRFTNRKPDQVIA